MEVKVAHTLLALRQFRKQLSMISFRLQEAQRSESKYPQDLRESCTFTALNVISQAGIPWLSSPGSQATDNSESEELFDNSGSWSSSAEDTDANNNLESV